MLVYICKQAHELVITSCGGHCVWRRKVSCSICCCAGTWDDRAAIEPVSPCTGICPGGTLPTVLKLLLSVTWGASNLWLRDSRPLLSSCCCLYCKVDQCWPKRLPLLFDAPVSLGTSFWTWQPVSPPCWTVPVCRQTPFQFSVLTMIAIQTW